MDFNVKYEELNEIGKYIEAKANEIDRIFDNIKKIADSVNDAWKGKDSDVFVSKVVNRIEKEKENNKKVRLMYDMISFVSGNYKDKDLEWKSKMKNEGFYNEY